MTVIYLTRSTNLITSVREKVCGSWLVRFNLYVFIFTKKTVAMYLRNIKIKIVYKQMEYNHSDLSIIKVKALKEHSLLRLIFYYYF